jgi:nucleoid-associated protein YgaU
VREPFLFEERPDNTLHRVISGDTLENLAEQFYNNALLFWVIADFQPEPLLDPSEDLETGSILVLPSVEYVNSKVLGSPEGARVIL